MRFVRCKTTSGYEAMILTPEQAYAIVCNLREPERTLKLLAAGTGLRISECLGLQWHDVNFADGMIHVRRTWTCGQVGLPKSKASKGPVPLHPLLAEFMLGWKQKTTHSQAGDWVFPSTRLNGKQPRVANMLVEDHLRKSFGMMVARDGVEPPTPAFSGIYNNITGLRWLRKCFKSRGRRSYLGPGSWAGRTALRVGVESINDPPRSQNHHRHRIQTTSF